MPYVTSSISPYILYVLGIGRHALCSYCFSCNQKGILTWMI
nr:MAG TPA: hypothetical protein [Caudoviricetes sp.]